MVWCSIGCRCGVGEHRVGNTQVERDVSIEGVYSMKGLFDAPPDAVKRGSAGRGRLEVLVAGSRNTR